MLGFGLFGGASFMDDTVQADGGKAPEAEWEREGEERVYSTLCWSLDSRVYHFIRNIRLPTGSATTHIDHVIVSRFGIIIIDADHRSGGIYGSDDDPNWTQICFGRKILFPNPLWRNFQHVMTLSDVTGVSQLYFHPIVVFTGDCEFKTDMPGNVMMLDHLIPYVRGFQHHMIKDVQVPDVANAIREWAATTVRREESGKS
jgi:restriction system protein